MSSSTTTLMKQFHSTLDNFMDELVNTFEGEVDLILLKGFIKDGIPPEKVMQLVITYILPHKEHVSARDDTFFLTMGKSLPPDKYERIQTLWNSPKLSKEDKNVLWRWIESFVAFAEHFQSLKSMDPELKN
jgi:hypothetical protein